VNANYLALIIMVGGPILQFFAYMYLAGKQRGKDEERLQEIANLKVAQVSQRLMIENIATYLEAKNGITFRRDWP